MQPTGFVSKKRYHIVTRKPTWWAFHFEHYPCYVMNIIPTSNSHLTALIRAILKNEHYPYWGISSISKMNIIPTCHLIALKNTIYSIL